MRPYGLSKRPAEDLCQAFTARTGIATVSLRPVAVWGPEHYRRVKERWLGEPRSEWEPFWEYGAFVDVRDVATAVEAALPVPLEGHHRALPISLPPRPLLSWPRCSLPTCRSLTRPGIARTHCAPSLIAPPPVPRSDGSPLTAGRA